LRIATLSVLTMGGVNLKNVKFYIVSSPSVDIEVVKEKSVYCPTHNAYFFPEKGSFIELGRQMYQAEKERAEWIRKYENVLEGLQYWKGKALEKN